MTPATMPLTARRNASFAEEWQFTVDGDLPFDFTAYTAALLEVRQYGAQPGDSLIHLVKVTSNIEGVRFLEPSQGIVRVQINQPTLETVYDGLIGESEPGSDLLFEYDLILTGPDTALEPWLAGTFTLKPGVSIDG